jgi:hypothetical protein
MCRPNRVAFVLAASFPDLPFLVRLPVLPPAPDRHEQYVDDVESDHEEAVAVTLTLCILYDQHIHLWEALLMVGLYVIYVLFVARRRGGTSDVARGRE